jgi:sugar lactone lactonase YvrE
MRRSLASKVVDSGAPRTAVVSLAFACAVGIAASADAGGFGQTLEGVVEGGGDAQPGYEVSLYASYSRGARLDLLGTDLSDDRGAFEIEYRLPPGVSGRSPNKPVLYVLAERAEAMLASATGDHRNVVVNELTTVATGTAFAQFIEGREISGNTYGMRNAVEMAANMANPRTGAIGEVLDNGPNGSDTSTRRTFYSLANIVAACVASSASCDDLFDDATPRDGPMPRTVLQAVANMTRYPSARTITDAAGLFDLSLENPIYGPALSSAPTSWLLFLKFTGAVGPHAANYDADNLMSGPGQIAIDGSGFAWINDNYAPTEFGTPPDPFDPDQIACAGLRLMKFYPWGKSFPGSPYFGGGLSGAGFGITLDGRGKVWVGNFGFEAPECFKNLGGLKPPDPKRKIPADHDSVSLFRSNGAPISGPEGFTKGHIWWPQGMASDKKGNVWVANCGNDTVTRIPSGNPGKAENIALPGGLGAAGVYQPQPVDDTTADGRPLLKPFGIAIDPKGRAWVSANAVGFDRDYDPMNDPIGAVYRVAPDGTVETIDSHGLLSWPMGISGDSKGNMWVSRSDSVDVPCVTPLDTSLGKEMGPALVYFPADDGTPQVFAGGGLTIPWGNFVDGNDTVWVFNFGVDPNDDESNTTPLSHFCGADTSKCPPGIAMGQPISPGEGYPSDALDRVTGGGVDPSGNIWILNNWKKSGPTPPVYNTNPGGNSFVIVPGAAGPIKTPLIGPPEPFDDGERPARNR